MKSIFNGHLNYSFYKQYNEEDNVQSALISTLIKVLYETKTC